MLKNLITSQVINLIEKGWLSDSLTRAGIRHLCKKRLGQVSSGTSKQIAERFQAFVDDASRQPIAPLSEKANEQHYEIPAAFYDLVLGPHKKYSCCLYENAVTLAEAEAEALKVTCQRAGLKDSMEILELGCGWGSLTLWMAEKYPNSKITAVSNSGSQRSFILQQANMRGIDKNLTVITADMNDFEAEGTFDRVVSVEMFEHMRNHQLLLKKVSNWLKPDGKLFVHIFCNRDFTYPFETEGSSNWMGQYFFTGGIMPGEELLSHYDQDLKIQQSWAWNGSHYQRTSNQWLENLDQNQNQVLMVLEDVYGRADAKRWLNRWRVFFMACAELFALESGRQWYVAHYLFEQANDKADSPSSNSIPMGELV